jgi:HK97 family phage major capsid protein
VELRTNMSTTDGQGGEFVPPLWLINQYLPLARAGRVTADLCNKQALPAGTDSINIPSVASGASVAEQTQLASASNTAMTTSSVSAAVTTLAGQQVFAMQLLDQSPINFDEVVFGDLLAELAKQVDIYALNKTSIGILNVSSINTSTYTDASPTVPELYPKIADGIQKIHTNRYLPPQAIVMHPRRWAWHLAALDANNRPLVVPNDQGPQNAFAGMDDVRAQGSVGTLQGLPVYVDSNVPTNLGAGTNEDRIIVARFDDLYLYEGPVKTRVLFETDADTLSVRLQVWEYAAFLGSRYPKSIAVVSGTGLVTPTF